MDDIWSIELLLSYDDLDVNFILNIDGTIYVICNH